MVIGETFRRSETGGGGTMMKQAAAPSKDRPAPHHTATTMVGDRFFLTEVREDDLVCGIEVTPDVIKIKLTMSHYSDDFDDHVPYVLWLRGILEPYDEDPGLAKKNGQRLPAIDESDRSRPRWR